MMLESWVERLWNTTASPEVIQLHMQDTLAAFVVGLRTQDGQALARRYRGRAGDFSAAATAISRLSECDDIHLGSCVTAGSIAIPVALGLAKNRSEGEVHRAIAAGYAAGLGLGSAIGGIKALASGVWPTLLAAPLMAAVTASLLNRSNHEQFTNTIAHALSGANGRVAQLVGTRWQLIADAVTGGIRAADAAGIGSHIGQSLLSNDWLAAQAGHDDIDISGLESPTASISQVGFKPFPIARQGGNAVIAFQRVLSRGLDPSRIATIEVYVPPLNSALLRRPVVDGDRLSRLANLGFQLACAGLAPEMLRDPERSGPHMRLIEFAQRVSVNTTSDFESVMPERWPARVVVSAGKERFEETVTHAPFDHDAPDLPAFLAAKWSRLLTVEDAAFIAPTAERYSALWQAIERRLTIAAENTEG